MSISGIGGQNIQRPGTQFPVRDNTRTAPQKPQTQTVQQPAQPATQAPANTKGPQGVPVDPPPGTDPALWSVLSGEERAFFAKAGAMGPLTYGRALQDMKTSQIPANRGGRLDVKI